MMVGKRQSSQKSCKPCFVHYPEQCKHTTVALAGTGDPDSSKPSAAVCEAPLDNQEHHKEFTSFLSYSRAHEKVPNLQPPGLVFQYIFPWKWIFNFFNFTPNYIVYIYRCSIFRNGFFSNSSGKKLGVTNTCL